MEREVTRLAKVLDASSRALVVLKRDHTIDFATESASGWMRKTSTMRVPRTACRRRSIFGYASTTPPCARHSSYRSLAIPWS